jgi:hypothetical protein
MPNSAHLFGEAGAGNAGSDLMLSIGLHYAEHFSFVNNFFTQNTVARNRITEQSSQTPGCYSSHRSLAAKEPSQSK